MSGGGDIVPLPGRDSERVVPDEVILPGPRTWRQLVTEGILITPNLLKLAYRLMRDRRVPLKRKVVVGAALAYLVTPLDVIPDVIPVLGQVDDVLLISFSIHHLIESVGREAAMEYWDGSEDAFDLVDAIVEWGAELVPAPVRRLLAR